jgi:hypothetical protein
MNDGIIYEPQPLSAVELDESEPTPTTEATEIKQFQELIDDASKCIATFSKTFWIMYRPSDQELNVTHLYSMQNGLIELDATMKKLVKIQVRIKADYEEELKKKVDAGELEYSDHVIVPVTKKTNRSVDDKLLKDYYKSFWDTIIDAKVTILKQTYKATIKDVEAFMGSLAEKVILQGGEAIDHYEIQPRE